LNRRLLPLALSTLAVLALITLFGHRDGAWAGTFNPELQITFESTTPETPSDFTSVFNLPKGDVNFAGVVSFIPKEWGIVRGDKIPVGADVGFLTAQATLGLINGACKDVVPVEFEMKNASLDRNDTVSFDDKDDNKTADYADDKDKNDILDGIDHYPEFLNIVFKDQQPFRRSAGISPVAGIPIMLQFLIFPPGTKIHDEIPSDEKLGYPTVTELQNVGDTSAEPEPGVITDFCTPLLSRNTSFGKTPDGKQLFVTPQAGAYDFVTVSVGQRDADGDGYENGFDTCAYDKNVGNPRVPYDGDVDNDGLDVACDPNDNPETGGTNSDQDADGYMNRGDNCSQVANGQEESKVANVGNQSDKDIDQIGDACDKNRDTADGELAKSDPSVKITIGGGGTGGAPKNCPDCYVLGSAPPGDGNSSSSKDEGGSSSGVIIIVVAVIAAIVIIGGGAALFMRRRRGS